MFLLTMLLAPVAALLASCSDDAFFTVDGKFADGADRQVTLGYYDGSGYKEATVLSIDGSFRLAGVSAAYTVVTLSDQNQTPLVTAIARNGDKLSLTIDPAEPINSKARGNKPTEAYNEFVRDNAANVIKADAAALNAAITGYIAAHPDNPESTALLTNLFFTQGYEVKADSLLRLIGPKARSRAILGTYPALLATQLSNEAQANITTRYIPGPGGKQVRVSPGNATLTLLAFSDDDASHIDSAQLILRELTGRFPAARLRGVELSGVSDSLSWAAKVAADTTATYDRSWNPVQIADRHWNDLAIPWRPFYVVFDSTGTQTLRTSSAAHAREFIVKYLDQ